jgi:hypothetical protein
MTSLGLPPNKQSLAAGISTCGSGAGTIIFAPLVTTLEANFGWQGCNRILSGLCLLVGSPLCWKYFNTYRKIFPWTVK